MRACVLLLALLVGGAARAEDDPFTRHFSAGVTFYQAGRYGEALASLEAAYALRQHPPVLFGIARCLVRVGRAYEAIGAYQRWLVTEPAPPPAERAEAEGEIARLQAVVSGPGMGAPPRPEAKRGSGLLSAGIALLAAGYGTALTSGVLMGLFNARGAYSYGDLEAASWSLVIPVLGPFVSAAVYREPVWALPWAVLDGSAQVGGLAMLIAGAVLRRKAAAPAPITIVPRPGGFAVAGTF